jgi:hypothetical protein
VAVWQQSAAGESGAEELCDVLSGLVGTGSGGTQFVKAAEGGAVALLFGEWEQGNAQSSGVYPDDGCAGGGGVDVLLCCEEPGQEPRVEPILIGAEKQQVGTEEAACLAWLDDPGNGGMPHAEDLCEKHVISLDQGEGDAGGKVCFRSGGGSVLHDVGSRECRSSAELEFGLRSRLAATSPAARGRGVQKSESAAAQKVCDRCGAPVAGSVAGRRPVAVGAEAGQVRCRLMELVIQLRCLPGQQGGLKGSAGGRPDVAGRGQVHGLIEEVGDRDGAGGAWGSCEALLIGEV